MRNIILIAFILCSYLTNGQDIDKSTIYLVDFDYFIDKLIETHPDPYSGFGNQIEFFREKQKYREIIAEVKNNDEFVVTLNQFISRLEDGHTSVYFPESNSDNIIKKIPIELKASADKLFVQNSTEALKNYIGKPVTEINNIPVNKLLIQVRAILPSENISGDYFNLIKVLNNIKLATQLFSESDSLQFTFSDADKNCIVKIAFQNEVSFITQPSKIEILNNNGLLYYSMLGKNHKIGYFAWNSIHSREIAELAFRDNPQYIEGNLSWAYSSLNKERTGNIKKDIMQIPALYEQFYLLMNEMKAKHSKYLIIDLRNNSGGMTPLIKPLLWMLYGERYLSFNFNDEIIRKISPLYLQKIGFTGIKDYNETNHSTLQSGDYTFNCFGNIDTNLSFNEKKEVVENGYSGFGSEYIRKLESESGMNFEIIVLSSPKTFSAAYHFAYFLKKLGNTTLIGVAPRQAGNSFMETTNFELPLTKLKGSISNSKQILFKDNPKLGKLLKPDYEMNWKDFSEFNFDKNAEILKAIDLIEKGEMNVR